MLGLPWLRTANPRINWAELCFEPAKDTTPNPTLLGTSRSDEGQNMPVPETPSPTSGAAPANGPPQAPDIKIIGAHPFDLLRRQGAACYIFHTHELRASEVAKEEKPAPRPNRLTPEEQRLFDEKVPVEYHDFADVFSKQVADDLPPHRPYDHAIDLEEGTTPPHGPVYSMSELELKSLREYLEEMLGKGYIRSSNSPAGAPVLFARKKDGSLRLCVDYRGLNKITKKNRYPLPLIGTLLDQLRTAKVFTKIDLRWGYNNVRISEGHEWKTAFRMRYGSFEYLVMPFGMTNSPATFQHFMNDIFRDMVDVFVVVYLDDILIFSKDLIMHRTHVRRVLQRLREFNLPAKLEKCSFHTDTVEYLGFVVSPSGISMDPEKTAAIRDWPVPKSVRDIQSFLGFANFYRRFIDEYSQIALPLTRRTRKDTPFVWDEACQGAFDKLKAAFTTAPILAHFDPALPTIVETDASDYAVAAIISQISAEDGELHPVAFHSRTMAPAEANYDIFDKELLAIWDAFSHWRCYLEGAAHKIQVFTDHKNLEYFATTKVLNRRQARWSEGLSMYDYVICYRSGKLGGKPDALTRRSDVYPKTGDGDYASANPQNVHALFRPGQLLSSVLIDSAVLSGQVKGGLESDSWAEERIRELRGGKEDPHWSMDGGFLLHDGSIYVPDTNDLRLLITQMHHDHHLSGHPGIRKTVQSIRRRYWWPNLKAFVSNYIASCPSCKRAKTSRHKPYGPLRFLPVPERPWHSISMDFIDGLPDSDGFNSVLVVVDRLTKMSIFIPTHNTIDAPGVAQLFLRHVFSKHGTPADIVSDRGKHFISRFWSSLCDLLHIKSNLSTAYHPETDGQTERVNQILEQYLRLYVNYQQDDWATLLPLAEFAYNNHTHSATGVSPFFANKGFHPTLSISVDSVTSTEAQQTAKDLSGLHEHLKSQLRRTIDQYAKATETRRNPIPPFRVGELVWLDARNIHTKRPMKKLDHRRIGPFAITDIVSSHARRLNLPRELRSIHNVFHVSLLEPHTPNTIPNRQFDPLPPVEVDGSLEHEVAEILDSKIDRRFKDNGGLFYRVRWSGYEGQPDEITLEPAANLANAAELVADFHRRYPTKPGPSYDRRTPATTKR